MLGKFERNLSRHKGERSKCIVTSDLFYPSIMYLGYYVDRGYLSFYYSQDLNPFLQNEIDEKLSHQMKGILLSDSCYNLHFKGANLLIGP